MNRLIIVEGLPCSGKSTVSKYIADRLGARFWDEGSGEHPADYEFHAYIDNAALKGFTADEQTLIRQNAVRRSGGFIVPLGAFSGEMSEKLLQYKIYDFLPWETEKPVMLDKWREFVNSAVPGEKYVFNCVLLQNPMCETMMRFGFDAGTSAEYIRSICDIISPLEPFVVYLHTGNIRDVTGQTISERGEEWLKSVTDYHCNGAYGKANGLAGFDGYITALEERQCREVEILRSLNIRHIIIDDLRENRDRAYPGIMRALEE